MNNLLLLIDLSIVIEFIHLFHS